MGYAAIFLTEGIGLWYEMSWAAYLAVNSTSFFIPFEVYELLDRITVLRMGILLLNLAIVAYLIRELKRHTLRSRRRKTQKMLRIPTGSAP